MDFLSATSVLIEYSDTVFRKQAVSMETEPAVSRWLGDGHSESKWAPGCDLAFEQVLHM